MITNRHPVDRLADVRAEMKILKAEEDRLRSELLVDDADLSGVENYARITTSETLRLDRKLAEEKFGKDAITSCLVPTYTTAVRIVARYADREDAA